MRQTVARRRTNRAHRPAHGRQLRPAGLSTGSTATPAAAAPQVRPVVRVRQTGRVLAAAPARAGEYVVRRGDTVSTIAARYAMNWPALWALNRNRIADPNLIYPGQVLRT
jgi:nucleoid-associated protein YgaU